MADSSAIDNALLAKLGADATLLGYMTNGVYWEDEAPAGATRLVEVSLVSANDEPMFGARAYEDIVYRVKAVEQIRTGTGAGNIRAAAARIDELLDGQDLDIEGYGVMVMQRIERIRATEVDDSNTDIRWRHRGGLYQVMVASTETPRIPWIQPGGWIQL
jgi:hypothetical protein